MGCSAHCPADVGLWILLHPVRPRVPSRTDAVTARPGVSWLLFRRALVPITPTSPARALDRFFRTGADFNNSGSLIAGILCNEAESDSSFEFQARVFAVRGKTIPLRRSSSQTALFRVFGHPPTPGRSYMCIGQFTRSAPFI